MDCPYCGTYNPEDRTTCWRCDKELPKPKPKKKPNPQRAQVWLYVVIGIFFIYTMLQTCGVKLFPSSPLPGQPPSGFIRPPAMVVQQIL